MLTSLLKALFPSRDPEQLVRERFDTWDAWLQPLPGDGCADDGSQHGVGRDPGYEDAFFALKDEAAKLSGIDEALIVGVCEQLLRNVGKDLRVAGYYAFARLRQQGPAGFAQGLELIAALVDRFGEALLPARPEAKKGALEWLAATRMIELLASHAEFPAADLERAVAALDMIVARTAQWSPAARPDLRPLIVRFERNDEAGTREPEPSPAAAAGAAQAAGAVASARDLLDHARTMAEYLRNQESGYLPSARLVRTVRWDTLHEVPPADARAATRLAPPRTELRQQMKRLVLQKQWHELLERVEMAFMEGANHLWFDLQYFQHVALDHAGPPYDNWRELLRADFALFLERLPGIERLAFNDGTSFADDTTLEWIARHAVVRDLEAGDAISPLPISADSDDTAGDWPEIEAQARDLLATQTLDAAVAWLDALPGLRTERQRYLQRMVVARIAEQGGRADAALPLLAELDAALGAVPLIRWEPALAFEVKQRLIRVLKAAATRKDADRAALTRRMEQLQAELVVLDPARALSLA